MRKYILNIIGALGILLFTNVINAQSGPIELKYLVLHKLKFDQKIL